MHFNILIATFHFNDKRAQVNAAKRILLRERVNEIPFESVYILGLCIGLLYYSCLI